MFDCSKSWHCIRMIEMNICFGSSFIIMNFANMQKIKFCSLNQLRMHRVLTLIISPQYRDDQSRFYSEASVYHRSPWRLVGCCCCWSSHLRALTVSQQLMMKCVMECNRMETLKHCLKQSWTALVSIEKDVRAL